MEVINTTSALSRIGISREELLIVNACLNEVCNGIDVFEFEARVGANRQPVAELLQEVGLLLDRMESQNR